MMATCVIHCKRMMDEETSNRSNKRTKQERLDHDSMEEYEQRQSAQISPERTRDYFARRKSIAFSPFAYIRDISPAQTPILFSTSKQNSMLALQQKPNLSLALDDRDDTSIFLSQVELAAFITSAPRSLLIVDCGSSLRYAERRINHSLLLNVNDKISRKRFTSRGLKNFLDQEQFNRLDQSQLIVLYDDSIRSSTSCSNSSLVPQLSPAMKCVFDEIKRHDANKTVLVLLSTFEDFFQHYPSLCHNTMVNIDDNSSSPVSLIDQSIDIDSCRMSEIIPGLFLGNAHDAADRDLLQNNHIQTIVNISSSIPCYFECDNHFDYLRLACEDSGSQNILQHFDTTFEKINERLANDQTLLVHCQGGVSRSPSFVIGYLMKYHSKTFDQAYQLVKSRRTIINPNLNFLGQLTQYQRSLTSV